MARIHKSKAQTIKTEYNTNANPACIRPLFWGYLFAYSLILLSIIFEWNSEIECAEEEWSSVKKEVTTVHPLISSTSFTYCNRRKTSRM